MQTLNLWNKLHICWPQTAVLIMIGLLAGNVASQAQNKRTSVKSRTFNQADYDDKWMHWGFQIGLFQSGMNLQYSANRTDTILVTQRPSFSLGFNLDFATGNEYLRVRFVPNFSFFERNIQFRARNASAEREDQIYESIVMELPLLLKYKSRRRRNHGMYIVAGFTPSVEIGGKASVDTEGLTFRKNNVELNYGVGFDLYWTFFKFAPEIRFSHGLSNQLAYSNNAYTNQLTRILTHKVTLYLNFE